MAAAVLVGRWLMCEGGVVPAFFPPDDLMGYEFRADGTWSVLLKNAAGECEPGTGFDNQGTWRVQELFGDPARFQVFTTNAAGQPGWFYNLASSAHPRKLVELLPFLHPVADPQ